MKTIIEQGPKIKNDKVMGIEWILFITVNLVLAYVQYWIGRCVGRFIDGDWVRSEDSSFYWVIGLILFNVIVWSLVGIFYLVNS